MLVYGLIAVVLLDRVGRTDLLPDGLVTIAAWVVTGYFTLGIAMNAISRSRPERLTMTPTCLVLAACSAVIALS